MDPRAVQLLVSFPGGPAHSRTMLPSPTTPKATRCPAACPNLKLQRPSESRPCLVRVSLVTSPVLRLSRHNPSSRPISSSTYEPGKRDPPVRAASGPRLLPPFSVQGACLGTARHHMMASWPQIATPRKSGSLLSMARQLLFCQVQS